MRTRSCMRATAGRKRKDTEWTGLEDEEDEEPVATPQKHEKPGKPRRSQSATTAAVLKAAEAHLATHATHLATHATQTGSPSVHDAQDRRAASKRKSKARDDVDWDTVAALAVEAVAMARATADDDDDEENAKPPTKHHKPLPAPRKARPAPVPAVPASGPVRAAHRDVAEKLDKAKEEQEHYRRPLPMNEARDIRHTLTLAAMLTAIFPGKPDNGHRVYTMGRTTIELTPSSSRYVWLPKEMIDDIEKNGPPAWMYPEPEVNPPTVDLITTVSAAGDLLCVVVVVRNDALKTPELYKLSRDDELPTIHMWAGPTSHAVAPEAALMSTVLTDVFLPAATLHATQLRNDALDNMRVCAKIAGQPFNADTATVTPRHCALLIDRDGPAVTAAVTAFARDLEGHPLLHDMWLVKYGTCTPNQQPIAMAPVYRLLKQQVGIALREYSRVDTRLESAYVKMPLVKAVLAKIKPRNRTLCFFANLHMLLQKTFTPQFICEGWKKTGQYPLDVDTMFHRCAHWSARTTAQAARLRRAVAALAPVAKAHGELTLADVEDAVGPVITFPPAKAPALSLGVPKRVGVKVVCAKVCGHHGPVLLSRKLLQAAVTPPKTPARGLGKAAAGDDDAAAAADDDDDEVADGEAGADEAGADEAGADEAGHGEAGADEAGADEAGDGEAAAADADDGPDAMDDDGDDAGAHDVAGDGDAVVAVGC